MFSIDWRGLLLLLLYLVVLSGALVTFSSVYRKRKASQSASLEPWFGPHLQRNVYLSLLHLDAPDGGDKAPKVPDSVVRAALLRRATEDIRRIIQVRTAKAALTTLLQRGSVGDDLWQRFQRAEMEMEEELKDVVMEANALAPNWGNSIFQSANEIAANTMLRKQLDAITQKAAEEKEWWDRRRAAVSSEFMKELENEDKRSGNASKTTASSDDGVLVEAWIGSRPYRQLLTWAQKKTKQSAIKVKINKRSPY
ncbi:hypothetical protein P8C59_003951 [Phyllachora maydis]|uniref:Uncharacterized protein n=1 Tax=Phyllachora maydis TaxID=1825666 RepID=A0AAD9I2K4_9PEZI|nr:hypothetical protein P8C59_003951 [Phyllachora maydis]